MGILLAEHGIHTVYLIIPIRRHIHIQSYRLVSERTYERAYERDSRKGKVNEATTNQTHIPFCKCYENENLLQDDDERVL